MLADFFDDYNDDTDLIAYRTLIGFSFEKVGAIYDYVIKVDDYEVVIKSLTTPYNVQLQIKPKTRANLH